MSVAQDLFAFAEATFRGVGEEMASYGVEADEGLALQAGTGVFCHYDLEERQVYLSIPDVDDPIGRFQAVVIREMTGCESDEELYRFIRLLLPRFITHELAHHYRHRHGRFGSDLWHEEHVANHLATAMTKRRMSPSQRQETLAVVKRAIAKLADGSEAGDADSYHSAVHALRVGGIIEAGTFETLLTAGRALSLSPEELLRQSVIGGEDVNEALERHEETIAAFNRDYASDWNRYLRTHLSWMVLDLESPQNHFIEEFIREYLDLRPPSLVSRARPRHELLERGAVAAFRAHLALKKSAPAAASFFYRRYREALLDRLELAAAEGDLTKVIASEEVRRTFEVWAPGQPEPLDLARRLLPTHLQAFLPDSLAGDEGAGEQAPQDMVDEADRRLWRHVLGGEEDEGAASTLSRLELLERADIFRALPAGVLLDLAATLIRQRYEAGEAVIWADDRETDVYILLEGRASAVTADGARVLGTIDAGQTFGEMAFLTLEPRTATVRADTDCEVFVLLSSQLRLLGYRHPVIFAELARAVARRLAKAPHGAPGRGANPDNRSEGCMMADLQSIAKRATEDVDFMKKLVDDPKGTLTAEGVEVTEEMSKAIEALDGAAIERAVLAFASGKAGAAF